MNNKTEARNDNDKLVSIIIPAYNCADHIMETVESVFAQTFDNFHLYIIDDGSDDSTLEVLSEVAAVNFTLVSQSNNGPSSARNKGFALSRSKYILFLDSDDLLRPDFLKRTVTVMESNSEICLVYTEHSVFDDNACIVENWSKRDSRVFEFSYRVGSQGELVFDEPAWKGLLTGTYIHLSTSLLRRSKIEQQKPFNETLTNAEDREFFISLCMNSKFAFLTESLVRKRDRLESLSRDVLKSAIGSEIAGKRYLKSSQIDKEDKAKIREALGKDWFFVGYHYIDEGNFKKASQAFSKALSYQVKLKYIIFYFLCTTNLYPYLKSVKRALLFR